MKKIKKTTVTVGIPAYNEEANIVSLISQIFSQNNSNFILEKIIVVSDCSSDQTDALVKKLKDKRVILHRNKTRSGAAVSQNVISTLNLSEVLIILNADIKIGDPYLIKNMVLKLTSEQSIGLVSVRAEPLPPKNLFQSFLNHNVEMKNNLFESWNNGINIYTCRGVCRGFSKKYLKGYVWPRVAGEDAYSYLSCISRKMKYAYLNDSKVYFQSPNNFKDHQRQSIRFLKGKSEKNSQFDKSLVLKEYSLPRFMLINAVIKSFTSNPLLFTLYCLTSILIRMVPIPASETGHTWPQAVSTKRI